MIASDKEHRILQSLAQAYGVQTSYTDVSGKRRTASPEALLKVLASLGAPVSRLSDVKDALEEKKRRDVQRRIEPVTVAWDGKVSGIRYYVPQGVHSRAAMRLRLESGEERTLPCDLDRCRPMHYETVGGTTFVAKELCFQETLPTGYHDFTLESSDGSFTTRVISAPLKAWSGSRNQKLWGLFIPLYSLYSENSLGAGDFGDMSRLYDWLGKMGGNFVGTLPFFAAFLDSPLEPSPYSPASRLFWNTFYIDLEKIPELRHSHKARTILDSVRSELRNLARAPLVDYRRQMDGKRKVIEELSRSFFSRPAKDREAFGIYRQKNPALDDYAEFRAFGEQTGKPWSDWPEAQRDGRIVAADFDENVKNYHMYAQWIASLQIEELSASAGKFGPGLYLDLPLGINPHSYDLWRHRDLFPSHLAGGAPPDIVFPAGQNWGFPPLHPGKIREDRYEYVIAYLSKIMQRAGILRIDHVPGLHRIFCIPEGLDSSQGVFVRYNADELYAILSLESHRNSCTIVGENLGTVPGYVNEALGRHNIFKMHVLQYELEATDPDALKPAPSGSIACLNTHDMPPFAGFLQGTDIGDRREAGILDPGKESEEVRKRQRVREGLKNLFSRKGMLAGSGSDEDIMRAAVKYLAASPARILLLNLEDLWTEVNAQNLPNTTHERPNWRRKARYSLEDFTSMPVVVEILKEIDGIRKSPGKSK